MPSTEGSSKKQTGSMRTGYRSDFLGIDVPLPMPADGRTVRHLDYTHFTVLLDPSRRLAIESAVNIDGQLLVELGRGDDWHLDTRIPAAEQAGPELYVHNDLDRGHLTRRRDPVWGDAGTAAAANFDSFVYTNAAPQAADFNQSKLLWAGLEDYILDHARVNARRPARRRTGNPQRGGVDPVGRLPGHPSLIRTPRLPSIPDLCFSDSLLSQRRFRLTLAAPAILTTHFLRGAPAEEGPPGVHEEALPEGLTADQHPEPHLVAIAQSGLGRDGAAEEMHIDEHHDAFLAVPGGAAHRAPIVHGALHGDCAGVSVLPRAHLKPDEVDAVGTRELLHVERVQSRTAGARVEFCLDPGDADARQTHPLAPASDSA